MKIIGILGFLNGAYMLADGIYVMLKGKYIGPEKPGPWSNVFEALGVNNIFNLGPLFIVFGLAWLAWVIALISKQAWSSRLGILMSILTLWYLPVGTLFSIIILVVLIRQKKKIAL